MRDTEDSAYDVQPTVDRRPRPESISNSQLGYRKPQPDTMAGTAESAGPIL